MRVHRSAALAVLFAVAASPTVYASPYSDDLSKCLVESSSAEEKNLLARWMFVAMSVHPAVRDLSKVTPEDREKSNKAMGDLVTTLLTDRCHDKADKAVRYEGLLAIQTSFQVLGQVAAQALFLDKDVAAVLSGLGEHVDSKKLNQLGKPAADEPAHQN